MAVEQAPDVPTNGTKLSTGLQLKSGTMVNLSQWTCFFKSSRSINAISGFTGTSLTLQNNTWLQKKLILSYSLSKLPAVNPHISLWRHIWHCLLHKVYMQFRVSAKLFVMMSNSSVSKRRIQSTRHWQSSEHTFEKARRPHPAVRIH